MNLSFSLLNLCLGIGIAGASMAMVAFAQPQEELSVRPMSVVPADEPALAPKPLGRGEDEGQQSLVPTESTKEKKTQPVSIPNALDFQSPLSPR